MKRQAFTLVELLVVIAVIAIVSAVLLPVFPEAREKARQTNCASNEKQLALGVIQYIQDYDQKLPNGVGVTFAPWGPPTTDGAGWASQIYPYIKSTGIFDCPDDPTTPYQDAAGYTAVPVSYAMNFDANGNYPNAPQAINGAYSKFSSPANTVLFIEISGDVANITTWGEPGDTSTASQSYSATSCGLEMCLLSTGLTKVYTGGDTTNLRYQTGYMGGITSPLGTRGQFASETGRHTEGANYAMSDGHVKWLQGSTVSCGYMAGSPTANQGGGHAAGTQASNPSYTATFSPI